MNWTPISVAWTVAQSSESIFSTSSTEQRPPAPREGGGRGGNSPRGRNSLKVGARNKKLLLMS